MIPLFTMTGGYPYYIFPLIFFVVLNSTKEILDDRRKSKIDNQINNKMVTIKSDLEEKRKKWKQL